MISDADAQAIAAEWHGGGGSAIYAFASTGTIHDGWANGGYLNTADEVCKDLAHIVTHATVGEDQIHQLRDLTDLLEYLIETGPRDPVENWYRDVISV